MTQRKYFASTWSGNIRVLVWKDGENGTGWRTLDPEGCWLAVNSPKT